MKSTSYTAVLALALVSTAVAQQKSQTATADFVNRDGKDIGRAALTVAKGGVLIDLQVSGLPANKWVAFHIHENGQCSHTDKLESAGGHFNPDKKEHGLLAASGPEAGDMPNQYVGQDGILRAQVFNSMVTLDDADNGIRGRALMIHADSDDYRSQPTGGSGERLACAVIE